MCNRYANHVSYRGYVDELSETRLPLVDYAAWLDSSASATALFTAPKKLPLHVELARV